MECLGKQFIEIVKSNKILKSNEYTKNVQIFFFFLVLVQLLILQQTIQNGQNIILAFDQN